MRHNNNWYDDPSGQSEIDLGFGLRQYDFYNQPKVQILTPMSYKEELQKPKLCTQCHNPITYLQQSQKWICYKCQLTWMKDFDTPLSSNENAIKPLQSNDPYERESPTFISFKPDRRLQGEPTNKHITISGTMRKAKIHVNGSPLLATEDLIRKELGEDTAYGY